MGTPVAENHNVYYVVIDEEEIRVVGPRKGNALKTSEKYVDGPFVFEENAVKIASLLKDKAKG